MTCNTKAIAVILVKKEDMTEKSLKRGNEILKEISVLEERIEDYNCTIPDVESDISRGEIDERIYHNNHNFVIPTKIYLHLLLTLREDCKKQIRTLITEFEKL